MWISERKLECLYRGRRILEESIPEEECSICLQTWEANDEVEDLSMELGGCIHKFHRNCFDTWVGQALKNGRTPVCPMCQQVLVTPSLQQIYDANPKSTGQRNSILSEEEAKRPITDDENRIALEFLRNEEIRAYTEHEPYEKRRQFLDKLIEAGLLLRKIGSQRYIEHIRVTDSVYRAYEGTSPEWAAKYPDHFHKWMINEETYLKDRPYLSDEIRNHRSDPRGWFERKQKYPFNTEGYFGYNPIKNYELFKRQYGYDELGI
jgi:hypothetical protein